MSAGELHVVPTEAELQASDRDAMQPLYDARASDVFAVLGYIAAVRPGLIASAVDALELTASMSRHPAGKHRKSQ